jgi:hypothetical protein
LEGTSAEKGGYWIKVGRRGEEGFESGKDDENRVPILQCNWKGEGERMSVTGK